MFYQEKRLVLILLISQLLIAAVDSQSKKDESDNGESLAMVISQSFFRNLQDNLTSPLINSLSGTSLGTYPPMSIHLGSLTINVNITEF